MTISKNQESAMYLPLQRSTDGIIIFNMMGIAIDANKTAAELLKKHKNDIISRGYAELFRDFSTGACRWQITEDLETAMKNRPVFNRNIMADIACRQLEYDCIPMNLFNSNTCNTLVFLTFRDFAAKTEYPGYLLPESA